MFFRRIENEKSLWMQYGIVLSVVAVVVVVTVWYLVRVYSSAVRENTLQSFVILNQKDAFEIENFLSRDEAVLNLASQTANLFIGREKALVRVDSLLNRAVEGIPRFDDLYGYVDGKWLGGAVVGDSSGPSREPWFYGALQAHGDVALVPSNVKGREQVVSLSRRLSDKKSVLALNVKLNGLRECIRSWSMPNTWMVVDKQGLVIARSNEANQGLNYLSGDFWHKDEERLVKEILDRLDQNGKNEKTFLFENYGGVKCQVFISPIKDKWIIVRLVEDDALWHGMRLIVKKGIAVVVLLYLMVALFMSFSLVNRYRAMRMSRAKSGFLTNMSREIRTSVTGLLGMNSIVMKEVRDAGLKDYLVNIQNAGQGILSLVNDVLDVCKIEAGKMNIVSMEYDIFSVLADCYSANELKASTKKLHFTVDCNPDVPSSLWGDENRIRQIINNLLSNAIKFTEVGEVTLLVNYENLPPVGTLSSDNYVMLSFTVKDTGAGIRKDELGKIFNKFALQNADDPAEGIGLGLCLTRELVEKCGGQITVNSRLGEGSSFTVRIPQLVLNVEPMGDFAMKYESLGRKKVDFSGIFLAPEAHVLIVDDIELNLKVLRGFLRRFKVQVDVAVSGAQCLKLAQSKHYDLIFLDHLMPVMDGVETYKRMKLLDSFINKDTPVIALTSEGSSEINESFLAVGFADYLPKPIRERDLQRALKWYLPKQLVLSGEDILNAGDIPVGDLHNDAAGGVNLHDEDFELLPVTSVKLDEKFAPFKEWLDIKVGMDYCANDGEIYLEMLQEFISSPLHRNADACFNSGDWENYMFYMHVLCDSSSAIGATAMAEKFQNLEKACRESRMNVVRENHGLVMALHADLVRNIRKGFEA